uniref:HDC07433 n=1 Tax=Drosophila melanogaster TaxID=7227 RepID=Q6IM65_DROME|nr:TPA_inf: HDC07433 [Drosophila melanogaster]
MTLFSGLVGCCSQDDEDFLDVLAWMPWGWFFFSSPHLGNQDDATAMILHINKSKARQGKAKQSPTIRLSSCQWHTLSRYNYAPDSQSFNQLQRPMPNLGYDFHSTNVQQRQCVQLYKRLVADYDFVLSMAWLKLQSPPYRLPISQICQTPQLPAYLMDT